MFDARFKLVLESIEAVDLSGIGEHGSFAFFGYRDNKEDMGVAINNHEKERD